MRRKSWFWGFKADWRIEEENNSFFQRSGIFSLSAFNPLAKNSSNISLIRSKQFLPFDLKNKIKYKIVIKFFYLNIIEYQKSLSFYIN